MNKRKSVIPCFEFEEAASLVAVVQVSSAAVERVFSQLTYIRHAVKDNTSHEMMELRALIHCNTGLESDFSVSGAY